ncbi:hypothetical protein A4A49_21716 [Nicotiana attenuata]|uniref:Uncharacterized protein n=1 Tax=Nicotiana attenuata TaxID=49451 RepID=A0A1J6JAY3_NICAT|nr:hypothetical protein A4A49_21716 [Nicotiana attenuata]
MKNRPNIFSSEIPIKSKFYQNQDLHSRTEIPSDHMIPPSMKKSNFEVYYGDVPLAIPFKWETQPGTPKVKFLETPIPPLTPPPSFQVKKKNAIKKQTKAKFLQMLSFLPKLNLRKSQLQSSSSSDPTSYSSSSLSSSSLSSPPRCWSYSAPASPYRGKFSI